MAHSLLGICKLNLWLFLLKKKGNEHFWVSVRVCFRCLLKCVFFSPFCPHPRTVFTLHLGREEGRERNSHAREKHRLVASCRFPDQGWNLYLRYVPWLGIEPSTFLLWDDAPTNWAAPARAQMCLNTFIPKTLWVRKCYLHFFTV